MWTIYFYWRSSVKNKQGGKKICTHFRVSNSEQLLLGHMMYKIYSPGAGLGTDYCALNENFIYFTQIHRVRYR
jgi:hypothetical protein